MLDTAYFSGGGEHGGWTDKGKGPNPPPLAARFRLEGDRLIATVLWSGIDGAGVSRHTGLLYHKGELFHPGGAVLDAATGKVLRGKFGKGAVRAVPDTRHMLAIAGGHIYGLREGRGSETSPAQTGVLEVYTLDGKKVASSELSNAPVEGAKKEQILATVGYNVWPFSYSCPFNIAGDRIYVRSNDYLYCIGEK